jgi:hypothetical protein
MFLIKVSWDWPINLPFTDASIKLPCFSQWFVFMITLQSSTNLLVKLIYLCHFQLMIFQILKSKISTIAPTYIWTSSWLHLYFGPKSFKDALKMRKLSKLSFKLFLAACICSSPITFYYCDVAFQLKNIPIMVYTMKCTTMLVFALHFNSPSIQALDINGPKFLINCPKLSHNMLRWHNLLRQFNSLEIFGALNTK